MFRSRVIRDSIFISPVKITLGKGLSKCDVIEVARGTMADNAVEGKPRPPSLKKGKGKFCCAGNCTNTWWGVPPLLPAGRQKTRHKAEMD